MIVITGASDGLGKALAKLYKEAGIQVVNISRRECVYADVNVLYDLSDEGGVLASAETTQKLEGVIDTFVNCAGVLSLEHLGELTWSEIDRVMRINVHAPIQLTSLLIERFKQDGTDIVNIASTAAINTYKGQPVYDASKHALRGFTNDVRLELENYTNRVIGVYPGMFDSEISQKIPGLKIGKSRHPVIPVDSLALLIKTSLDMPKVMEVADIVINRKVIRY